MSEEVKEMRDGSFLCVNKEGKAYWGQPDGYPYRKHDTIIVPETVFNFGFPLYDAKIVDLPSDLEVDTKYNIVLHCAIKNNGVNKYSSPFLSGIYNCIEIDSGIGFIVPVSDVDFSQLPRSSSTANEWVFYISNGALYIKESGYASSDYYFDSTIILSSVGTVRTIAPEYLPEGYPYKEQKAILDGTFEFTENNGNGYAHLITDESFSLVEGETYTIIWDGETYQCVAVSVEAIGGVYIGNSVLLGDSEDTGEPFVIAQIGTEAAMMTQDTAAAHNVSVYGAVYVPINVNYIPNTIARVDENEDYVAKTISLDRLFSFGGMQVVATTDTTLTGVATQEQWNRVVKVAGQIGNEGVYSARLKSCVVLDCFRNDDTVYLKALYFWGDEMYHCNTVLTYDAETETVTATITSVKK